MKRRTTGAAQGALNKYFQRGFTKKGLEEGDEAGDIGGVKGGGDLGPAEGAPAAHGGRASMRGTPADVPKAPIRTSMRQLSHEGKNLTEIQYELKNFTSETLKPLLSNLRHQLREDIARELGNWEIRNKPGTNAVGRLYRAQSYNSLGSAGSESDPIVSTDGEDNEAAPRLRSSFLRRMPTSESIRSGEALKGDEQRASEKEEYRRSKHSLRAKEATLSQVSTGHTTPVCSISNTCGQMLLEPRQPTEICVEEELEFLNFEDYYSNALGRTMEERMLNDSEESDEDSNCCMSIIRAPRRIYRAFGKNGFIHESAMNLVQSTEFDLFSALLVITNGILIGAESNFHAMNLAGTLPAYYEWLDTFYCVIFTTELSFRLYVFGTSFFCGHDVAWNYFDFLVVGLQLVDVAVTHLMKSAHGMMNFSFLRLLRMMRLLRIMRLVRILHLVVELRSMISSIVSCFKPLFWGLVILLLLMYIVGVFFLQAVTDKRLEDFKSFTGEEGEEFKDSPLLLHYYGSLCTVVFSLWACISGGIQWAHMMMPLLENVSPGMAIIFIFYIAFSLLAMMNVITGIFVETAMKNAQADQDVFVAKTVVDFFDKNDLHSNGDITWDTFRSKLECEELQELFRALNIDASEARGLFQLIDEDQSGTLTPEELMQGWVRLQGPAKSLDLALHMRQYETTTVNLQRSLRRIERRQDAIKHTMSLTLASLRTSIEVLQNNPDGREGKHVTMAKTLASNSSLDMQGILEFTSEGSPSTLLQSDTLASLGDSNPVTPSMRQNAVAPTVPFAMVPVPVKGGEGKDDEDVEAQEKQPMYSFKPRSLKYIGD